MTILKLKLAPMLQNAIQNRLRTDFIVRFTSTHITFAIQRQVSINDECHLRLILFSLQPEFLVATQK